MISLLQVSEQTDRLVLSYPIGVAIAFLVAASLLLGYAVYARKVARRRWALAAATLVAAWAGLYFATFSATITRDGGSVYAFMRYDHSVRWQDAADIYLEQRGGGHDWHIVVLDRQRRAYDFNVADLSIDDRDRVMAYMVDRMPESAFHRDTTVMRREGPGPRPASFSSDQQI